MKFKGLMKKLREKTVLENIKILYFKREEASIYLNSMTPHRIQILKQRKVSHFNCKNG